MSISLKHPLICVVGPTATGKSALAQCIAERLNGVILSADSMQIYRGMDIGTGKVPVSQRTVPYYGIDLVDPDQAYSASLYQSYGRDVISRCDAEDTRPIVCGGTGFYVKALIDELDFPPGEQVGNPVREYYASMHEQKGSAAVWEELHKLDPESAAIVSPNDTKRVIRALELHAQGLSYREQKERFAEIDAYYPTVMLAIAYEPEHLAQRIDKRVDEMIEAGLVQEVQGLLENGYEQVLTANQAIGYKEMFEYLRGECSLDAAVDRIKTATRQYAKRQRTWFRKDKRIHWLDETKLGPQGLLAASLEHIGAGR